MPTVRLLPLSLLCPLSLVASFGCGAEGTPADFAEGEDEARGLLVTEVIDADGNLITFYDYDGDGTPNAAVVDEADEGPDGDVDHWWYDSDDDGRWDRHTFDTDDDGEPDTGEIDWDGDGQAETFWIDLNGDGHLDPGESVEVDPQPLDGPRLDEGQVTNERTVMDGEELPSFTVSTEQEAGELPEAPAADCTYGGSQYPYGFDRECIDGLWHQQTRHWWFCQSEPTYRETFEWTATNELCDGADGGVDDPQEEQTDAVMCEGPIDETLTWECDETWKLFEEGTLLCSDGSEQPAEDVIDTHQACSEQGHAVVVDDESAPYESSTCPSPVLLEEIEGEICEDGVALYRYRVTYGCADGSLEEVGGDEVIGDC